MPRRLGRRAGSQDSKDKPQRFRSPNVVAGDTGVPPPGRDTGYSDESKYLKGSRMGQIGRPPEKNIPPDFNPNPTEIIVEGRSPMQTWGDPVKRAAFDRWRKQAEDYGLVVHEVEPGSVAPRRKWARVRIPQADALSAIRRAPGILFDDWAKLYLAGHPENATTLAAARKKATVALHALHVDSKIEKRYSRIDGRMTLYIFGKAPKDE